MKSVLKETRARMDRSLEVFDDHIATVRTGRANPAVLNRVHVNYYGASTPLNQLATISSPDPRTLMITPFDKSVVGDIERAILESDLGFNPNNQGENIFINVPALNDERRQDLARVSDEPFEQIAVAGRACRRDSRSQARALTSTRPEHR